jgi:hypothetical protein
MSLFDGSSLHWITLPLGTTFSSLQMAMSMGLNTVILSGVPGAASRSDWKSLIGPSASLQTNCNEYGINVGPLQYAGNYWNDLTVHTRLGFMGNQGEDNCETPDSVIGFGNRYSRYGISLSVGNYADGYDLPDNGAINMPLFGYILGA